MRDWFNRVELSERRDVKSEIIILEIPQDGMKKDLPSFIYFYS